MNETINRIIAELIGCQINKKITDAQVTHWIILLQSQLVGEEE